MSGIMLTLPLIAMLSLGFSFQPVRAEPETRLYVDPPTCGHGPSDSFTVNIDVANVNYLYAWQLKLQWNPDLLKATSLEEGAFLKDVGETRLGPQPPLSPINNTLGLIIAVNTLLGVGAFDAPNGSGTLVSVTFIVKAAGECSLNLSDTELYTFTDPSKPGQPVLIPHTVEDGYFFTAFHPSEYLYCQRTVVDGLTPQAYLMNTSVPVGAITNESLTPVFASPPLIEGTSFNFTVLEAKVYHQTVSPYSFGYVFARVGWYDESGTNHVAATVHEVCEEHEYITYVTIPMNMTLIGKQRLYIEFRASWNPDFDIPTLLIFWGDSSHDTGLSYLGEAPFVPDFPSFFILPVFMIATLLAVIVYRRKHSK